MSFSIAPQQPRTQSEDATRALEAGLWLEDGNVVLIAEDTPFKVHRNVLCHNSQVFRDKFSQVVQGSENNGALIVALSDAWKDVQYMLSALYYGGNTDKPLSFAVASALLRLGTKYNIVHLRDEVVARLKQCFPPSLEDFNNCYAGPKAYDDDDSLACIPEAIQLQKTDVIGVINLARLCDLPFLLPPAFYICSALDLDDIFEGVQDEDGRLMKLSPEDIYTCIRGREDLIRANLECMEIFAFPENSFGCAAPFICNVREQAFIHKWWTEGGRIDTIVLVSPDWVERRGPLIDSPLCILCRSAVLKYMDAFRQLVWNSLGEYFSVPDWPIIANAE
ncbi:unnamed protein product [Somion occarium]|uniref:BTB domain-containing protein n=1 Tax=Somion occarium TaxID=3059160 RepID=A0ABP1EAB3_9APHY